MSALKNGVLLCNKKAENRPLMKVMYSLLLFVSVDNFRLKNINANALYTIQSHFLCQTRKTA